MPHALLHDPRPSHPAPTLSDDRELVRSFCELAQSSVFLHCRTKAGGPIYKTSPDDGCLPLGVVFSIVGIIGGALVCSGFQLDK
jgi:hypothetical protein